MKILSHHVKNELSAYLQNELNSEQMIYIEQHLVSCKECKKECEEIEQGIFWAKQIQTVACPESLWNNIETKLSTQKQTKTISFPVSDRRFFPQATWARACVVAIVTIIFISFLSTLLSEKKDYVAINSLPSGNKKDDTAITNLPKNLQTIPTPTLEKTNQKEVLPFLNPVPPYKNTHPGNVLRAFERGKPFRSIDNQSSEGSPDKPKLKLFDRGFGTKLRTDPIYQIETKIDHLPINRRSFLDFSLSKTNVSPDNQPPIGPAATSGLSFSGRENPPLGFVGPRSTVRINQPMAEQESGDFIPVDDRWRIGFPEWDRRGDITKTESNNTEDYKSYGVNFWTNTKKDMFSTFAVDVDTGSYTMARRKLNEGVLPPAESVRVEEFVNYFKYQYPNPATEHPFSLTMEAAGSPFNPDRYLLRIGLKGREVPQQERLAAHLTFLVDTSGSMESEDKIELVKKSLKMLTNHLQPQDTVAITTYAGGVSLVLPPTHIANKDLILNAIDELESGGGTAMEAGIDLAYKQALFALQPSSINRVIICSDGDANIGNTSPEEILKQIEDYVEQGITVSTIGFGMGNYKDTMMEQFANKGNGNYYYIDSMSQAKKVFVEQLSGTLQVIAKDVKVQVEFNPATVKEYRLVGYENRDIADKDFRNDKVDAGEIGAGHTVTAIYEVKLQKQPQSNMATVRLRYKTPDANKQTPAQEVAANLDLLRIEQNFSKASEDFRFSVAVAAFAEVLRGSVAAKDWSLDKIANIAETALQANNEERKEFFLLVKKAQQLKVFKPNP